MNRPIPSSQAGTYNVTILNTIGIGPFSPHPASFLDGTSVKVANVTVSTYPAPQLVNPVEGGVPVSSTQAYKNTVDVQVSGFTVQGKTHSTGHFNFQGEAKFLGMLWFSAFNAPWNDRQRLFIVYVDVLPD